MQALQQVHDDSRLCSGEPSAQAPAVRRPLTKADTFRVFEEQSLSHQLCAILR